MSWSVSEILVAAAVILAAPGLLFVGFVIGISTALGSAGDALRKRD